MSSPGQKHKSFSKIVRGMRGKDGISALSLLQGLCCCVLVLWEAVLFETVNPSARGVCSGDFYKARLLDTDVVTGSFVIILSPNEM